MNKLLERGDIDALIIPTIMDVFLKGHGNIVRLFPDFKRAKMEYDRKAKVFPVMHTVVARRDVNEQNRWIAKELTDAFTRTKDLALREFRIPTFLWHLWCGWRSPHMKNKLFWWSRHLVVWGSE